MTSVAVYDATTLPDGASLATLPRKQVTAQGGWVVNQVLQAAGYSTSSVFCLVTPEIERNLRDGLGKTFVPAYGMLGLDAFGVAWFRDGRNLQWDDFVRAVEAHLYQGDPDRAVVYPGGLGGGPPPDGLLEAVSLLFDSGTLAVKAAVSIATLGAAASTLNKGWQGITAVRTRRIAQQWRKQGFTASRIRDHLERLPQWDEESFAGQRTLTVPEARLALANAGYELEPDGLWRPGVSETAQEAAATFDALQRRAEDNPQDT